MNKLETLLQNFPESELELFAFFALEEQKQIKRDLKNLKKKNN